MKQMTLLALAGVLTLLVTGCDGSNRLSYNETYDEAHYRDVNYGPSEREEPLFALSPSGGNTYALPNEEAPR